MVCKTNARVNEIRPQNTIMNARRNKHGGKAKGHNIKLGKELFQKVNEGKARCKKNSLESGGRESLKRVEE